MTDPKNEPEVDRGQLIFCMARIQKQCDNIDALLSLSRIQTMRPVTRRLQLMREDLRETMRLIHRAMKPEEKR